MSLGMRKLIVGGLMIGIICMANTWDVAKWLHRNGLGELAQNIRQEYLTGAAVAVIVALLILIGRPGSN